MAAQKINISEMDDIIHLQIQVEDRLKIYTGPNKSIYQAQLLLAIRNYTNGSMAPGVVTEYLRGLLTRLA